MKFVYWKAFGEWRWHLKAGNGEIIASGEAYRRKIDLLQTIRLVKHSTCARVIEIKSAKRLKTK